MKVRKWLFEGWGHQQYSVRSIQQLFHQGCNRIGIKRNVKPHSLRHSRATRLHEAKVDIKDIQDFLGHSHIKTTADFYLKLSKKNINQSHIRSRSDTRRYCTAAFIKSIVI